MRIFENGVLSVVTETERIATAARSKSRMTLEEFGRLFMSAREGSAGGGIITSSRAWQHPWVRACIDKKATYLSGLPFEIRRNEETKVEKHPLLDLLSNPNDLLELSTEALLWQTIAIRELRGEAFWLLDREGSIGKVPKRIWIYEPSAVQEKLTPDKRSLLGWTVSDADGKRYFFDKLDVLHFPIYDPTKKWRGSSWLSSLGLTVSSDVAAQEYNYDFFRRGATPGAVFETDEELDIEAGAALLQTIKAKLQSKGHEPLLLHSGVKASNITQVSARDSEFIFGRKINRDEILAAAGVPPVVVGLLEFAAQATADQQIRGFWQATLKPIIRAICGPIGQRLLEPGLELALSTAGVEELKGNVDKAVDSAQKLCGLGVPYNIAEKALKIGTGPIPGGDVGFIPYSVVPIVEAGEVNAPSTDDVKPSQEADTKPQPAIEGDANAPAVDAKQTFNGAQLAALNELFVQVAEGVIAADTAIAELILFYGLTEADASKMVNAQLALKVDKPDPIPAPVPVPAPATSKDDRGFAAMVADIEGQHDRDLQIDWPGGLFADTAVPATREAAPTEEDDTINEAKRDTLIALLIALIADGDKRLAAIAKAYYVQSVRVGAAQGADLIGDAASKEAVETLLASEKMKALVDTRVAEIVQINRTTEEKLIAAVTKELDAGATIEEIADSVRTSFNFTSSRAQMIARTEVSQTVNSARFEIFRTFGVQSHEWVNSADERVRETHNEEGGNVVELGERFPVTELRYPGDPEGEPGEIINCRCISIPQNGERSFAGANREARDQFWRATVTQWQPVERRFKKALQKYLFDLRASVLKALADFDQ